MGVSTRARRRWGQPKRTDRRSSRCKLAMIGVRSRLAGMGSGVAGGRPERSGCFAELLWSVGGARRALRGVGALGAEQDPGQLVLFGEELSECCS